MIEKIRKSDAHLDTQTATKSKNEVKKIENRQFFNTLSGKFRAKRHRKGYTYTENKHFFDCNIMTENFFDESSEPKNVIIEPNMSMLQKRDPSVKVRTKIQSIRATVSRLSLTADVFTKNRENLNFVWNFAWGRAITRSG
jgi:hypothetical protein